MRAWYHAVIAAFDRLRLLWGALDWEHGSGTPYSSSATLSGGTSAVSPGIGVRRCELVFDRTTTKASSDPVICHLDFLNITGGAPDDTWTTSDYTTLEGYITTWLTTVRSFFEAGTKFQQFRWYRVGPGIVPPNPAERVNLLTTPLGGTGAGGTVGIPQAACSITFRTAVRRSWGRTYIPATGCFVTSSLEFSSTLVDNLTTATQTLVTSAAGSGFTLVVISRTLNAALAVEAVEVDSVPDVVRRRRWKHATYKKVLP
jgi:hypothetical protein